MTGQTKPTKRFFHDTGKGAEFNGGESLKLELIEVDGYFVGAEAVTWHQYEVFCKSTGHPMPPTPPEGKSPNDPVVNVSASDCDAFCAWAGLRLPTSAEHEAAEQIPEVRESMARTAIWEWCSDAGSPAS